MGLETILLIAGLAVSAAGAGMQYSAAQSAAKDQATLALVNAQAQTQAARQAGDLGVMQAATNEALAKKDEDAANANARALEAQAAIGTTIAQNNVAKSREDFARMLAANRVLAAKSGVADTTGSPLELAQRIAAEDQATANTIRYDDEVNRRGLFQGAGESRNEGVLARINGLSQQSQGAASRGNALNQVAQAKLDLYGARAGAQAMRNQATGALVSQAGSLMSSAYGSFRATPRRANAPYAAGFNANGNPIPYAVT